MPTLPDISVDWLECQRCGLAEGRRTVVAGTAWSDNPRDTDPLVLIVGEAPGCKEDETGEAFVGPSGDVLRGEILAPAGVRLAFITNLVACRPPGNRDPVESEMAACAPRLDALVEALAPDVLMLVGRFAAKATGAWRSRLGAVPVVPIVHPAWLLRQGHPTTATRQHVADIVRRVSAALAQAGAVPEKPVECEHEWVAAGVWRHEDGRTAPLAACQLCGRVRPPGEGVAS